MFAEGNKEISAPVWATVLKIASENESASAVRSAGENDGVLGVFLQQQGALKRDERVCARDTDGRIAASTKGEVKQPCFGAIITK